MTLCIELCLQNWICRILELKTLFTHLHASCCFVAVRSWGNQMGKVASPFSLSMSRSTLSSDCRRSLRHPCLPALCPVSSFFFLNTGPSGVIWAVTPTFPWRVHFSLINPPVSPLIYDWAAFAALCSSILLHGTSIQEHHRDRSF